MFKNLFEYFKWFKSPKSYEQLKKDQDVIIGFHQSLYHTTFLKPLPIDQHLKVLSYLVRDIK